MTTCTGTESARAARAASAASFGRFRARSLTRASSSSYGSSGTATRKLEPIALVVADQPGADGDDSALQVDAALDSIHNDRGPADFAFRRHMWQVSTCASRAGTYTKSKVQQGVNANARRAAAAYGVAHMP